MKDSLGLGDFFRLDNADIFAPRIQGVYRGISSCVGPRSAEAMESADDF